jgi:hypothetical protein
MVVLAAAWAREGSAAGPRDSVTPPTGGAHRCNGVLRPIFPTPSVPQPLVDPQSVRKLQ